MSIPPSNAEELRLPSILPPSGRSSSSSTRLPALRQILPYPPHPLRLSIDEQPPFPSSSASPPSLPNPPLPSSTPRNAQSFLPSVITTSQQRPAFIYSCRPIKPIQVAPPPDPYPPSTSKTVVSLPLTPPSSASTATRSLLPGERFVALTDSALVLAEARTHIYLAPYCCVLKRTSPRAASPEPVSPREVEVAYVVPMIRSAGWYTVLESISDPSRVAANRTRELWSPTERRLDWAFVDAREQTFDAPRGTALIASFVLGSPNSPDEGNYWAATWRLDRLS